MVGQVYQHSDSDRTVEAVYSSNPNSQVTHMAATPPQQRGPKYLGKTVSEPVDDLDTFPAPSGIGRVTMTCDELTSLCPVTGQPDQYTVTIEYEPRERCIESKSLKLYLWHFRDSRVFCEQLAVDIRDKVIEAVAPARCRVALLQKARGGITIEAVSIYES